MKVVGEQIRISDTANRPFGIAPAGGQRRSALVPGEGHGFARPENRLRFYAAAVRFLAEHLGGRCEPGG